MKRMFRWKDVLMCAANMESAWVMLMNHAKSMGGYKYITEWEREETRHNEDPMYNIVNPREYLHAINPEEPLEILDEHLPTGMITVSDEMYAESAGVVVLLDAESWALLLPVGWMHVPDFG